MDFKAADESVNRRRGKQQRGKGNPKKNYDEAVAKVKLEREYTNQAPKKIVRRRKTCRPTS